LISKAKKKNIVTVHINDPFSGGYLLTQKLKERYRLEDAVVIDTNGLNNKEALAALAKAISVVFTSRIANGNLIGVSAGYTVAACSQYTNIYNCRDLRFVPLIAGESCEGEVWYVNRNCARFAKRFDGKYLLLNTPLIIREEKVRCQIAANLAVKPVLDCYRHLEVLLLGIGQTCLKSTLGRCAMSKEKIIWANEHAPWRNIGQQFPELLSTVFGNISICDNLKLLDLQFPKSFSAGFKGPRFGTKGLRNLLGIHDRPLTLAMIKPCTGIPVDVIERQFYKLCLSGVDMIKDDELLADPAHAPLFQRLEACQRAAAKAYQETGKKVLYFPNITDRQDRMLEKAHKCIEMGVEALMLNVHASGYGTLGALAEDDSINVPLLAQRRQLYGR
jgi:hypothetical protein